MAERHRDHLPHPRVHVEGAGQPSRQFGVVERQPGVEARVAERLPAHVAPHPVRDAHHLHRLGQEHLFGMRPHRLREPRPRRPAGQRRRGGDDRRPQARAVLAQEADDATRGLVVAGSG
jgi:hypothetical protein